MRGFRDGCILWDSEKEKKRKGSVYVTLLSWLGMFGPDGWLDDWMNVYTVGIGLYIGSDALWGEGSDHDLFFTVFTYTPHRPNPTYLASTLFLL